MPRPVKCRLIESEPQVALFKAGGIPAMALEDINITYEELEAIRLKDLEGLDQAGAAVRMNVSRPTFQRILRSARVKISDALVNGRSIRIQGGNYSLSGTLSRCDGCGHEWRSKGADICPRCACQKRAKLTSRYPRCPSGRCGHEYQE